MLRRRSSKIKLQVRFTHLCRRNSRSKSRYWKKWKEINGKLNTEVQIERSIGMLRDTGALSSVFGGKELDRICNLLEIKRKSI